MSHSFVSFTGTTPWPGAPHSTHHFKPICLDVEVGVFLVALDDTRFSGFPCTFNENLGAVYREKLDLLQFTNTPEQNLYGGLKRRGQQHAATTRNQGADSLWQYRAAEHTSKAGPRGLQELASDNCHFLQ